jgi:hypothetical protein
MLAKQADKYSIMRSMTHGINGHETAAYTVQTGRASGVATVFPGTGAVVSLFKGYDAGYKGLLPPYIVLTELQGRFSEAGFPRRPLQTLRHRRRSRPIRFVVEGVVAAGHHRRPASAPAASCSTSSTSSRATKMPGDPRLTALGECEKQAYDLILGDAGKVFDSRRKKTPSATLRPQHLRPVLPHGAPARRTRRPYHHHQLQGLGHPQAALPHHAPQTPRT